MPLIIHTDTLSVDQFMCAEMNTTSTYACKVRMSPLSDGRCYCVIHPLRVLGP